MQLRALTLSLAALAAPLLSAQEAPHFGVQAGANLPLGDLKDAVDSKLGLSLGAHATFDFGGGHRLRPRLDYTFFPEYSLSQSGVSGSMQFTSLGLGADYLYFVGEKQAGLYLTGGLAITQWKADVKGSAAGFSFSGHDTTTRPTFALGAGYQFNRTVGVEGRFLKSRAWDGDLDMLQAGVTLRF